MSTVIGTKPTSRPHREQYWRQVRSADALLGMVATIGNPALDRTPDGFDDADAVPTHLAARWSRDLAGSLDAVLDLPDRERSRAAERVAAQVAARRPALHAVLHHPAEHPAVRAARAADRARARLRRHISAGVALARLCDGARRAEAVVAQRAMTDRVTRSRAGHRSNVTADNPARIDRHVRAASATRT